MTGNGTCSQNILQGHYCDAVKQPQRSQTYRTTYAQVEDCYFHGHGELQRQGESRVRAEAINLTFHVIADEVKHPV